MGGGERGGQGRPLESVCGPTLGYSNCRVPRAPYYCVAATNKYGMLSRLICNYLAHNLGFFIVDDVNCSFPTRVSAYIVAGDLSQSPIVVIPLRESFFAIISPSPVIAILVELFCERSR